MEENSDNAKELSEKEKQIKDINNNFESVKSMLDESNTKLKNRLIDAQNENTKRRQ